MEHKPACINSYNGHCFDPTAAAPDDLCIEDIAHALSLLCRANGHLHFFYSVAQHCLACQQEAALRGWSPRLQLLCLLHDASEAYIGDLTRPLKRHLPVFSTIEEQLQQQIFAALGISAPSKAEQALVAKIDDDMLYWEFHLLHPTGIEAPHGALLQPLEPAERPAKQVETDYLTIYTTLMEVQSHGKAGATETQIAGTHGFSGTSK